MGRKVLLCGDEAIGYIEQRLTPYIGTVAAEVADHRPLLGAVLQQYFTGMSSVSINDILMAYPRIPSDVAREIEQTITSDLIRLINRAFGCVYPGRRYLYEIDENCDVLISEFLLGEMSEEIENVETQLTELELAELPGLGVSSSIVGRMPANAMNGRVSPFERQRRLANRLACHSAAPIGDYEEAAPVEDPQFA